MAETSKVELAIDYGKFNTFKILIPAELSERIKYMFTSVATEVGALCCFSINTESNVITLDSFYVPKQTVTSGDVDFDEDGVNDCIFQAVCDGKNVNGWIHSHAKMSAFWSGIDLSTISKLKTHMDAPLVSVVGNKAFDWVGRVDFPVDSEFGRMFVSVDKIPVETTTYYDARIVEEIDAVVKDMVTVKTYTYNYKDYMKDWDTKNGHYDKRLRRWFYDDESKDPSKPQKKLAGKKTIKEMRAELEASNNFLEGVVDTLLDEDVEDYYYDLIIAGDVS